MVAEHNEPAPVAEDKATALALIEGLTFADCATFFAGKATTRDNVIASMVETNDELNCDWPITSEGNDNGAWVLTWTWVDFHNTALDKDEIAMDEAGAERAGWIAGADGYWTHPEHTGERYAEAAAIPEEYLWLEGGAS